MGSVWSGFLSRESRPLEAGLGKKYVKWPARFSPGGVACDVDEIYYVRRGGGIYKPFVHIAALKYQTLEGVFYFLGPLLRWDRAVRKVAASHRAEKGLLEGSLSESGG